ncbi:MAG: large-conductance mechanosensitive channel protein MscL [Bacteroides sp.]|nr:large-conductance mechanosensitive channel protein MscL [Prevotella sp.]MCM1408857.1 large-conductance mechanosensitive channel protein MscL [Treponema brennaborense]MCM1470783.1 large-conductance mechanosensitive channel protein MscL [Bacteroides sp.]
MVSLKEGIGAASKEIGAFKKFISRGNVVDMAVGVIIGGAFGKIVTSFVNDIIMPLIGLALGRLDFAGLSIEIGSSVIKYGNFIQTVVDFLIIAVCIFFVIRVFESFKKKEKEPEENAPAPAKSDEALLLEEIRDLLKERK